MHVLYLSHTGMSEPLGQSQVLAYLRGLAKLGHTFDLISFEPDGADEERLAALRSDLAAEGIRHVALPRSSAHDLATKARESAHALALSVRAAITRRPAIIHARSTLPSAIAFAISRTVPGAKLLFDCRGLLAKEYADAGHWQAGSLKYDATMRAESLLFRYADGVVTLTERLRSELVAQGAFGKHTVTEVVPCCVDTERFRRDERARDVTRTRINAGDRLVVLYSGTLGSWYCEEEMASLFAQIRRKRPALFLVLTRSPQERLRRALAAEGVTDRDVHFERVAPQDMPGWLAGADVGLSLITPSPSKIASSPTKVAEYLAAGLRVVMNRGVGDADRFLDEQPELVDAGDVGAAALKAAAARAITAKPFDPALGLTLARRYFDLDEVGVSRYARLYDALR